MKIFRQDRTSLTLSPEALAVYTHTDPLQIIEHETPDGLRYELTGAIERADMTAEELNDFLSGLGSAPAVNGALRDQLDGIADTVDAIGIAVYAILRQITTDGIPSDPARLENVGSKFEMELTNAAEQLKAIARTL